MSETLCTLRTKGGGGGATQTETVLWTNSAPTNNFSEQTVTLAETINNYDYLKFTFLRTKSSSDTISVVVAVSEFKKSVASADKPTLCMGSTGSYTFVRRFYYVTDTTCSIANALRINAAASDNSFVIPLSIIGIKNMGGIRTDEKYDYLPFTDMPGGQTLTWNTKGRAKAVWVVMGVNNGVDYIRTNVNPSTGEIDNDTIYIYNDNASGASPTIQSGVSITVTDNTVSTNSFSASTRRFALIYTY